MTKFAVLALAALSLVACGENQAATQKCAPSVNSEACSKCCTENGASGHSFVGTTCTCRGGG